MAAQYLEALAAEASGREFGSQHLPEKLTVATCVPEIPVLGSFWDLLAALQVQ